MKSINNINKMVFKKVYVLNSNYEIERINYFIAGIRVLTKTRCAKYFANR